MINDGDLRSAGIAWADVKELPVHCPYQGEGWTLSFSKAFYHKYQQRGFSLKALCLALASGYVNFNPETGQPIPQCAVAGYNYGITYPFYLPDCFKSATALSGDGTAEQTWRPDRLLATL